MKKITIITLAVPGKAALKGLMMANSLRSFGGDLRNSPIWWLVPDSHDHFSDQTRREIDRLKIQTHPFRIESDVRKFPFGAKVVAAAQAEAAAVGETESLVWLDLDNIILSQPDELLLPPGKSLAYRPVHHRLIGPTWGDPLDPFWSLVYTSCKVPPDYQFQMVTHTGEKIQPYFNAGTFVTRPETGLMACWQDTFLKLYQKPQYQTWYQQSDLYAIFMHQVIFTGVILAKLSQQELHLLSPGINYPLHLHNDVPEDIRPSHLQNLTTLRYENIFDRPGWLERLPILAPLQNWLTGQNLLKDHVQSAQ